MNYSNPLCHHYTNFVSSPSDSRRTFIPLVLAKKFYNNCQVVWKLYEETVFSHDMALLEIYWICHLFSKKKYRFLEADLRRNHENWLYLNAKPKSPHSIFVVMHPEYCGNNHNLPKNGYFCGSFCENNLIYVKSHCIIGHFFFFSIILINNFIIYMYIISIFPNAIP